MIGRGVRPLTPQPQLLLKSMTGQKSVWAATPAGFPPFSGPTGESPRIYPEQSRRQPLGATASDQHTKAHQRTGPPSTHPCAASYASSGSLAHARTRASAGTRSARAARAALSPVVPLAHAVVEPLAVVVETAHALVAGAAVLGASAPAGEGGGAQGCRPAFPALRRLPGWGNGVGGRRTGTPGLARVTHQALRQNLETATGSAHAL